MAPWWSPLLWPDYRLLFLANICEFIASTMAEIGMLVWIYDSTGENNLALGFLGVIALFVQVTHTHTHTHTHAYR